MSSSCSFCCRPINLCPIKTVMSPRRVEIITPRRVRFHFGRIRASKVESYGSSSDFVERMERAWLISQVVYNLSSQWVKKKDLLSERELKQPRPVACSSCESNGNVECKWCSGTGFFIIGDNMLCQVPSRNTTCVICAGKGSVCCPDCKGTGFRAKWLGEPPVAK